MEIRKYQNAWKSQWDQLVSRSINGTFLFYRDYMEYHSDRFEDCSLLFFENDQLIAVLPASKHQNQLSSHGGLTFGGLLYDEKMSAAKILDLFRHLVSKLSEMKISKLIYKAIPYIYHRSPCQEDLYALYRLEAKLIRRDISSTISFEHPINLSKSKRHGVARALKENLIVKESSDYEAFIRLLNRILKEKYGTQATHTVEEIELLASRFPENIRLFGAYKNDTMLAGTIIYENPMVAHIQYMANSESGKEVGALDITIQQVMRHYQTNKKFFDFGISTENNGLFLNEGLIKQKEMFGARGVVYDFYELDISDLSC